MAKAIRREARGAQVPGGPQARPERQVFARFRPEDALLIVDVQRDFCSGGRLAIGGAEEIIPRINGLIGDAMAAGATVFASRDWHPANHMSFVTQGGPWPSHCVAGSKGAEFHPDLRLPLAAPVVSKGTDRDRDEFSVFERAGLIERLRQRGTRRVVICGLALDVCVRASALDAARAGFETHVALDATRPITKAGGEAAVDEMMKAGVILDRTE
jgi:nicotinamidase/pyrazinamidase